MTSPPSRFEALARQMMDRILENLHRRMAHEITTPWKEMVEKFEAESRRIHHDNRARAIDGPSEMWNLYCSGLLAAYRALTEELGDPDRAIQALQEASTQEVKSRIEDYVADRFGITQAAPEQAFALVRKNFIPFGRERYGRSYVYEIERDNEREHFARIEKCFFSEFLRDNHAPQVTEPLFCQWDHIWMKELSKPKYGLRIDRPTTLAADGPHCLFRFFKAAKA